MFKHLTEMPQIGSDNTIAVTYLDDSGAPKVTTWFPDGSQQTTSATSARLGEPGAVILTRYDSANDKTTVSVIRGNGPEQTIGLLSGDMRLDAGGAGNTALLTNANGEYAVLRHGHDPVTGVSAVSGSGDRWPRLGDGWSEWRYRSGIRRPRHG